MSSDQGVSNGSRMDIDSSSESHVNGRPLPNGEDNNVNENRQRLENQLEGLLETLRQSVIIVEDFRTESQPVLNAKVNKVMEQLESLDNMRNLFDIDIPVELVDFVSQGKNPDRFTKDFLENTAKRNEKTKGKIHYLKTFKEALEGELEKAE